jgi:hypothetical protein
VALGNTLGIQIFASPNNTIGGTAAGAGNVISGNLGQAIEVNGTTATGNSILGNFIGTNAAGTAALANAAGVLIDAGASLNTIGGTTQGARNIISGNSQDGIDITGSGTTGTVVEGDYIGTNAAGNAAIGNQNNGISITSSSANNTIGGLTAGPGTSAGNVISGNSIFGISLTTAGANNLIEGNIIGLDAVGSVKLGNTFGGIHITAGLNTQIGGTNSQARNVISGNKGPGIDLSTSGTSYTIVIQGNYIGTDITGNLARGNLLTGVVIGSAPGTILGGTLAGAGNVISGNTTGVDISNISHPVISGLFNSLVQGNIIGLNAGGTAAVANGQGIVITNSNNLIGGKSAGEGNIISGNTANGISINSSAATGNIIEGNFIGTNPGGTAALANHASGVIIQAGASHNIIGDTAAGAGNIIAFNAAAGVVVGSSAADTATVENSIRGNSIHDNGGLGIDLGNDGVTLNDSQGHVGPNNFQNFPVLTAAKPGATTEVVGSLSSTPSTTFALDFYGNTTADPSGYGEGRFYLGSGTVTTDVNGFGSFDIILSASTTPGEFISVTATDPSTSEFSKDLAADTPPSASIGGAPLTGTVGIPIPLVANVTDPDPGQTLSYAWSVTLNGSPYTLPITSRPPNKLLFSPLGKPAVIRFP